MAAHVSTTVADRFARHFNRVVARPNSSRYFSCSSFCKKKSELEANTAIAAFMLFCYLTTFVAYFKVFRIIRQHQQQVQGNQYSQIFGQPAINLTMHKKSVVTILYILALFSCCFLPVVVCVVAAAHVDDMLALSVALTLSLVFLFSSSYLNSVCIFGE